MSSDECKSLADDLFLLDMDELPEERRPVVLDHLERCPECKAKHGKFEKLKAAARTPVGEEARKEAELVKKWPDMVARARKEAEQSTQRPGAPWLLILLLVLAGGAIAAWIYWRSQADSSPPVRDPHHATSGGDQQGK